MEGTASAKAYRSGRQWLLNVLSFLKKKKKLNIYLFIGCVGSLLPLEGLL